MRHIILMGDSIIDNGSYIGLNEPDVAEQLRKIVPENTRVTKLAIDGDVISGINRQLTHLPNDTTDIIISIGGNDALGHIGIFDQSVSNVREAVLKLSNIQSDFEKQYSSMLKEIESYNIPFAICTIYYPRFNSKSLERVIGFLESQEQAELMQTITVTTLSMYNDIITKLAVEKGIPIIDLRTIFTKDEDYANPIEPSAIGGAKLVNVMLNYLFVDDTESVVSLYS